MFTDILGALVSLLSTYFFIRLNTKAWPLGLLATCINGWLYWYKGIYADMLLEVFYFIGMCYGWYLWGRNYPAGKTGPQTLLKQLHIKHWLYLSASFISIFLFIQYFLSNHTNSDVAFLDSATTSLSLLAQWLMCHKVIATWYLWFITDAVYALMYWSKELPFHSGLMLVYTGMAITGYLTWARRSRQFTIQQTALKTLTT